jgi:tRNA threonylcarbamoyladenosine biosynthesis protein TsaE
METITQSAQETQKLGESIGTYLKTLPQGNTAQLLLLQGELGSGKTTFMQGVVKGLGIPHRLVSPTFIMIKEYEITYGNYQRLYHIDLYRVTQKTDLETLGLTDIFANRHAIVAIEWPERMSQLPSHALSIQFKTIGESRKITMSKKIAL